jgi:UDP-glucose 4-epimerase
VNKVIKDSSKLFHNVAVLGANGFLGSHVVDALVARGHKVNAFDNFASGSVRFASSPLVQKISGDFFNPTDLTAALAGSDTVIHLVSATTPVSAEADPTLDIQQNLLGSVALFRQCAATSTINRVVFASSGGTVYGSSEVALLSETAPVHPVSPYGICKLATEHYLAFFAVTAGLSSVSLRISNPYGDRQPLQRRQGVIPVFIENLLQGFPVLVYGDGSMVRDFIHISDVAAAFVAVVEAAQPQHGVYNVGSGMGESVLDVLAAVAAAVGTEPVVKYQPTPLSFVPSAVLDTARFRSEFAWAPQVNLTNGIADTVAYVRRALAG